MRADGAAIPHAKQLHLVSLPNRPIYVAPAKRTHPLDSISDGVEYKFCPQIETIPILPQWICTFGKICILSIESVLIDMPFGTQPLDSTLPHALSWGRKKDEISLSLWRNLASSSSSSSKREGKTDPAIDARVAMREWPELLPAVTDKSWWKIDLSSFLSQPLTSHCSPHRGASCFIPVPVHAALLPSSLGKHPWPTEYVLECGHMPEVHFIVEDIRTDLFVQKPAGELGRFSSSR